jgi:hypothetical protein
MSEDSDRIYKFDPFSGKIVSKVKGLKEILIKNASYKHVLRGVSDKTREKRITSLSVQWFK